MLKAGTSGTDISTATEASSLDCHFCGVDSPPACGEMVVENPLSRVGHTQVAAFGAFFKNRWQAW